MEDVHIKKMNERVIAFIDLGTNSARLLIVHLYDNYSYRILRQHKITVRLGEDEFVSGYLTDEAMNRAIVVCRGFYETALNFSAVEIIGYATSATRDAKNRELFLERLCKETNIEFDVISGNEEARLIWLGITQYMMITESPLLFIDIGGGSTELILGNKHAYSLLHSLCFGSIRTTTQFFSKPKDPIPADEIQRLRKHLAQEIAAISREIRHFSPVTAIGTSGTIITLERLAKKTGKMHQHGRLTRKELKDLCLSLSALSSDERCALPGMNKERGDIIVAGSWILYALMKACAIHEINVTEFGLRDGMLVDYLSRCSGSSLKENQSVRDTSIHHLAKMFHVDKAHVDHVFDLTAQMFDSAHTSGLITYDEWWRELLLYASLVHDVGEFVSHSKHQLHSAYIVSHAEIVGFSEHEILIIALLCRYHRKRLPREKDPGYNSLPVEDRRTVFVLSCILRCAEALDCSHDGRIKTAVLSRSGEREIELRITAMNDCTPELWAVEEEVLLLKNELAYEVNILCTKR